MLKHFMVNHKKMTLAGIVYSEEKLRLWCSLIKGGKNLDWHNVCVHLQHSITVLLKWTILG